jgi:hypothetical protein
MDGKNLIDVVTFLRSQHPEKRGIVSAASKRLGVTPQDVSAILKRDDAGLAWAERLARAYGYRLCLIYPDFSFRGVALDNHVKRAEYPDAGNLSGLVQYAKCNNLSINSLSHRAGVNYRIIQRAFRKGDIMISYLKHIEKSLGIQIKWIWTSV